VEALLSTSETDHSRPSKEKISLFLVKEFPQIKCEFLEVGHQTRMIVHEIGQIELRSGGTISGPVYGSRGRYAVRCHSG
jgi:hypothetical protein